MNSQPWSWWSYYLLFIGVAFLALFIDLWSKEVIWNNWLAPQAEAEATEVVIFDADNEPIYTRSSHSSLSSHPLSAGEQRPTPDLAVIPRYLHLTRAFNTGAAFGFGAEISRAWFMTTNLVAILLVAFSLVWRRPSRLLVIMAGILLGGALGNFYDRLIYQGVRDFINIFFWPIFNFADIFIVVGGIVYIIAIMILPAISPPPATAAASSKSHA